MKYATVAQLLDLLKPDSERLRKGIEKMARVWRNEEPASLPLFISAKQVSEASEYEHYTLQEQFEDKEKMLIEHLWGLIGVARGGGDGQLAMRANLGVGLIPSIFGLKSRFVQPHQMPWVMGNLSQEQIAGLELPEVKKAGLIPKAVEYIAYFREKLEGRARVYLSDTQGPFDIAHLLRGPDIYYDLYDAPDFVRRLMELATEAYIEVSKLLKEAVGEPLSEGYHGQMWMEGGGARICDDSAINLSEKMYREFVQPCMGRALTPFSGGWYHFCGNGNHILDAIVEIEQVRGVNFGNPEMFDFSTVMPRLQDRGKFYYGPIPVRKEETASEYFCRIKGYLGGKRKGLILDGGVIAPCKDSQDVVELWSRTLG